MNISSTKNAKISIVTFSLMNITTVLSTRGLAPEAEYGLTSIFYYLFAAIFFLIPVALVAAELATGWPQRGGVFTWIKAAFGEKFGFLAIYLQWIATTICFPTMLIFIAVSFAFIEPDYTKWLATNKYYTLIVVLSVYWFSTYTTSKGIKSAAKISAISGFIGTIIPLFILITLGIAYVIFSHNINFVVSDNVLLPDFTKFHSLVLAASVFLFYSGMEINAVHVQELNNPSKSYPFAISIASIITVILLVLGTLAISAVIPKANLNLVESLFATYDTIFRYFHIPWMSHIITSCIAIGVFGQVTVIVAGPSTGLFAVGQQGYLPTLLQKFNKHNVQMPILYIQGIIVTVLSLLLIILPSVQSTFQILGQLAAILYLSMYMLMFLSVIYLRYKEPETPRPYKIPGGKFGIWVIAGVGFIASLLAFILSFIPPSQINTGNSINYIFILLVSTLLFISIPFVILKYKKKSWLNN